MSLLQTEAVEVKIKLITKSSTLWILWLERVIKSMINIDWFEIGRFGRDLQPVLGQAEKKATDSLFIQKDCGDDMRCVPDLSISFDVP